ncbi:MAG: hypothetical protein WD040_00465 [Anaerolineales bacterium]
MEPLSGAGQPQFADKSPGLEIVPERDLAVVKIKNAAEADVLMKQEANVQPQRVWRAQLVTA